MLWRKALSYDVSELNSFAAQLFEMVVAPSAAAVFSAVSRFVMLFDDASTKRMWQVGHTAEAMSTSSEISSAQPALAMGMLVPPVWFTLRKQWFAVVHAGRP